MRSFDDDAKRSRQRPPGLSHWSRAAEAGGVCNLPHRPMDCGPENLINTQRVAAVFRFSLSTICRLVRRNLWLYYATARTFNLIFWLPWARATLMDQKPASRR